MSTQNWRDDPGLKSEVVYKKRFALFPVKCTGGVSVWLDVYYKKYTIWSHEAGNKVFSYDSDYFHTDFDENISEDEYLVRKLAETL